MINSLLTQRDYLWLVGDNCESIKEHQSQGDGDRWFYDVLVATGKEGKIAYRVRIFDAVEITFVAVTEAT